jgi:hypothetical protein
MTQRLANETVMPDGMRSLGGVYVHLARCGLSKPLRILSIRGRR